MKRITSILLLAFALAAHAVPLREFAISCYFDPDLAQYHVGVFVEGLEPGETYVLERRYLPGPWHEVPGHTWTAGFGFDYEARWLSETVPTAMYRVKKL